MSATPGLSYSMSLSSTRPLESKPARTLCGAFRSGGLAIAMTRIPPHSLACTPHIAVLLPKGYILGHDKQPKRTQKRIHVIRGKKVMLDSDLASLYEVEVKQLNQAVKRNINRFPDDFMFRLTKDEFAEVVTNCDHLQMKYRPTLPNVFTEQGVAMLAAVLNSQKAIDVNIQIMRAFIQLRNYVFSNHELHEQIGDLRKLLMLHMENTDSRLSEHDEAIRQIMLALNGLIEHPPKTKAIGFGAS